MPDLARRPALLAGLVFAGAYCFFFCAAYPQWHDYGRLTHGSCKVPGRVVAKEPDNHRRVTFDYVVNGRHHSGHGGVGFGGVPPFERLSVGDSVPVTYLPEEPGVSVAGDPAELYASWSSLIFGVLPLGSLLAAFASFFRLRRRLSPAEDSSERKDHDRRSADTMTGKEGPSFEA